MMSLQNPSLMPTHSGAILRQDVLLEWLLELGSNQRPTDCV
jgi:hypothetical protein